MNNHDADLFHTDQLLTSEDMINRKISQLDKEAQDAFRTIVPDETDARIRQQFAKPETKNEDVASVKVLQSLKAAIGTADGDYNQRVDDIRQSSLAITLDRVNIPPQKFMTSRTEENVWTDLLTGNPQTNCQIQSMNQVQFGPRFSLQTQCILPLGARRGQNLSLT